MILKKYPWSVIVTFLVLGLIGILNHSMWRDELNPWLIVRDSSSFTELIHNIHYEGHPVLWYFSLAVLRQIVDNPIIMQLFHLLITTSSIIVFWLYSPFTQRQKLLFTFGFLPFSEYLLISRNYAFSLLFTFLFCAFFTLRKKSYLILAILLGLLANSSAYALFVSFSLFLTLLGEFCFNHNHRNEYFSKAKKYDLPLSCIFLLSCFTLAVSIIKPPLDSNLHGGLNSGWFLQIDLHHFLLSLGRIFGAYFLILPKHQWLDLIVCGLIAVFVIVLTVLKIRKKPFSLSFYILANGIIFAFTYLRFLGHNRHFAHFYIVLILVLWLANYESDSSDPLEKFTRFPQKSFGFVDRWYHYIFMIILYFNLGGGVFGFTRDLFIPLSASRATINYINNSHLEHEFIVASRDANMATISGYLNRKLYYPELQQMGSFTLFTQQRKDVDHQEVLRQVSNLLDQETKREKILLILHQPLKLTPTNLKIIPLQEFKNSWIDSERFYLYWVQQTSKI